MQSICWAGCGLRLEIMNGLGDIWVSIYSKMNSAILRARGYFHINMWNHTKNKCHKFPRRIWGRFVRLRTSWQPLCLDYSCCEFTFWITLSLEKEVNGKQACYKYSLPANAPRWCPQHIDVFCHFTNAANSSVQSPPMKLTLLPGECTEIPLKSYNPEQRLLIHCLLRLATP